VTKSKSTFRSGTADNIWMNDPDNVFNGKWNNCSFFHFPLKKGILRFFFSKLWNILPSNSPYYFTSAFIQARCLYNKVGFQWGFFVSCGSQKISATRWRSNQVTAVRAANACWHPTAIICARDGAAPTWSLFAMFQKNVIVVKCFADNFPTRSGSIDAPITEISSIGHKKLTIWTGLSRIVICKA
jgi:hypothetical protein